MKRGRPDKKSTKKRDCLEIAQAELIVLVRDLDEVIIRNRQAVRRTQLVADVLEPGIERLEEIKASILLVHENVNSAWNAGQERDWK